MWTSHVNLLEFSSERCALMCYLGANEMGNDQVEYFNRYTGKVEVEQIYGEGFLRWVYGNPLGKLSLEGFVKRALFSKWYGGRMNAAASRARVAPFIRTYALDFFGVF